MIEKQKKIAELARRIKLSSQIAELAMEVDGPTHQDYLIALLEAEVERRKNKRIDDNLRKFGAPYKESFDEFNSSDVRFPEGLSFAQCRDLKFVYEKKNILMYGNTGTGKTMLSICIGLEACRNDIPVRFFRTEDLITRLLEARTVGRLKEFKDKLYEAEIIILDEFGFTPYDLAGAQLLFGVISEIYGKKILIMTTNKDFNEWYEILIDPKMTKAFIGRVTHHCHMILFPGDDWRFKNSSLASMFESTKSEYEEGSDDEY